MIGEIEASPAGDAETDSTEARAGVSHMP